ncbi:MAG: alpha-L-fucosidase [Planctomycetota bacterium]|nr:alpha-L-fucosidase [Planctomycetota bacterium]
MRANTDWFRDARWGVFMHFLSGSETSADRWNCRVEQWDVDALAAQLEAVGAGYYFITFGQSSGFYCSPNDTYDSYVGLTPSRCSERDLVSDLYDALQPRNIRLMVYLPATPPIKDPVATERLSWEPLPEGDYSVGKRQAEFQPKWEAVIREWSLRYGTKVSGWWFDGCYYADAMYRNAEPPNFQSFAAAARAGNKDSLIAFNPGVRVPVISMTEHEDYTAGEISTWGFPICRGRWVDDAQFHIISFLGEWWMGGEGPRFPDELVVGITKQVNSNEGVVTWDVPHNDDGTIPAPFVAQLEKIGK